MGQLVRAATSHTLAVQGGHGAVQQPPSHENHGVSVSVSTPSLLQDRKSPSELLSFQSERWSAHFENRCAALLMSTLSFGLPGPLNVRWATHIVAVVGVDGSVVMK